MHALSAPPNLGRIERLTTLAWASGAQPVVLLTKADLVRRPRRATRPRPPPACPGVEVICVSTDPGHPAHAGLDELRALLPAGATGAFIGPSGVGKSSLVNALAGADVLATGAIRDDGKGRHTSVTRELVPLPWGALVIDTPGLRGVQLWDAEEGLDAAFADIVALAEQCRFSDCQHRTEPGCAVRAAVADGHADRRGGWRATSGSSGSRPGSRAGTTPGCGPSSGPSGRCITKEAAAPPQVVSANRYRVPPCRRCRRVLIRPWSGPTSPAVLGDPAWAGCRGGARSRAASRT